MNIIEHWASLVESQEDIYDDIPFDEEEVDIQESEIPETPDDEESLNASFEHDVSDVKMQPTEEFLRSVYNMFNTRLFDDRLPGGIIYNISHSPRADFIGSAGYRMDRYERTINTTRIQLNGTRTLTLHEWMGVVLHEMVHIYDYEYNPSHFFQFYYDPHGKWFLEFGKQFEKYGYHVQKYCDGSKIGINTQDKAVRRSLDNSIYLVLHGMGETKDGDGIVKIKGTEMEKYKEIFQGKKERGRLKNLTGVTVMQSDNPETVRLSSLRMKNDASGMRWYYFTDEFKEKYGPFTKIEGQGWTYDNYALREDKDEMDIEDIGMTDDKFARHMYDDIESVVDVKNVGDGKFDVDIQ